MRTVSSPAWAAIIGGSAVCLLACSSVDVPPGPGFGSAEQGTSGGSPVAPESTGDGSAGTSGSGAHGGTSGSAASDAGVDAAPGVDAGIYATPVQCTTGTQWTQGEAKSALMMPGSACRSCHVLGGKASGKSWDISGTVYATAHEPDDCNGTTLSGVTVVITGSNGAVTTLPVNAAGNFWHNDLLGFAAIPKPYTAKVVSGGKVREMIGAQTDGDCNKCHTLAGTSLAPGRVMLP